MLVLISVRNPTTTHLSQMKSQSLCMFHPHDFLSSFLSECLPLIPYLSPSHPFMSLQISNPLFWGLSPLFSPSMNLACCHRDCRWEHFKFSWAVLHFLFCVWATWCMQPTLRAHHFEKRAHANAHTRPLLPDPSILSLPLSVWLCGVCIRC